MVLAPAAQGTGSRQPFPSTVQLDHRGYSDQGPGAGFGHLWKTADAGGTWTDISGNLPDIPVNDVLLSNGRIYLATDLGVVTSGDGGASWSRLGSNLPYTATLDIHRGPDSRIYAATHGRGIWSIAEEVGSVTGRALRKAP